MLFMSGYIDNREVSEQLADHADAILQKPFSTTELREQVRFLLDQRYALDQPCSAKTSSALRMLTS